MFVVSVAIATPLYTCFDYLSVRVLPIGVRVKVSFSGRIKIAVVLANPKKSTFAGKLKPIIQVLDDKAVLGNDLIKLLKWAHNYYHHPIGEVIFTALPKNLRLGKPALIKKPLPNNNGELINIALSSAQQNIVKVVLKSKRKYQAFLLHGITGSGKTEVYISLAQSLIKDGKQILILVPEIGLTPQMIARFRTRIKTTIAVIHSQLSGGEKTDAYLTAQAGEAGLILGTRSAVFTPIKNLGLIIIDEEHDDSFKQQSEFRYCAKELSFIRAKQLNIPLLLGSATPSLQSLHNVFNKKMQLLSLLNRTGSANLPHVNLIDMRQENNIVLSSSLLGHIKNHLNQKSQVMLFINRRGYAPVLLCKECSWQATCTKCSANMVLHQSNYRLKCHHCGVERMPPNNCDNCHSANIGVLGFGTERLEEVLYAEFPTTDIIRIDRDNTANKNAMANHLNKIASGKPCIIVGTQMLAKGHDFANLSLVGILNADAGLFSIDFRAEEKLAQLLIQVAGRAGRDKYHGQVYIQTHQPNHPIFIYIKQHQYLNFTKLMLKQRQSATLPPFSYQALICTNAKNKKQASDFLHQIKDLLLNFASDKVQLLGPSTPIIEKKANYYYQHLYLLSPKRDALHKLLTTFTQQLDSLKNKHRARWFLDINPLF